MKTVNHVMSIIDVCVEPEKKNQILSRIGIKRRHKDLGFVQEIYDHLNLVSEAAIPRNATTPVAEGKKEGIKEKRNQNQKEKDAVKSKRN